VVTPVRPQPERPAALDSALPDPVATFLRHHVIATLSASEQRLSERNYCEMLLVLANTGALSVDEWQTMLSGAPASSDPGAQRRWMEGVLTDGAVEIVRDQLGQLVKYGPKRAQSKLGPWWADSATRAGMVLLPSFLGADGNAEVSYRLLARDGWAAITFAMTLFFDAKRTFGRDLCRCKLEDCGKFFFVKPLKKRGRPRRDYCTPAHAKAAYDRQLRERVAASRAGLSVAEWRRRKS
jgi:hypothetical protein